MMLNFLQIWYQRRMDYSEEWQNTFSKSLREIMLWCPNNVLYHLGMYLALFENSKNEETKKSEFEKHFGKTIISYRSTLGYKNKWWEWWKRVTPEQIILFYSAGEKDKLN